MKKGTIQNALLFGAITLLAVSCAQPLSTREKGVLAGGGLGAATGAIVGSATGNPGAGAAIGGALGGVTGGLVGDRLQQQEQIATEQQRSIDQQRAARDSLRGIRVPWLVFSFPDKEADRGGRAFKRLA
jgi:uncharacterized protein YcfJ